MKIALCVWRDLILGSIAEVLGSIAEVLGSIAEVLGSIASRTLSVSRTGIEGRRNVVTLTQIAIIAKVFRFNSWTEFSSQRSSDSTRGPSFPGPRPAVQTMLDHLPSSCIHRLSSSAPRLTSMLTKICDMACIWLSLAAACSGAAVRMRCANRKKRVMSSTATTSCVGESLAD